MGFSRSVAFCAFAVAASAAATKPAVRMLRRPNATNTSFQLPTVDEVTTPLSSTAGSVKREAEHLTRVVEDRKERMREALNVQREQYKEQLSYLQNLTKDASANKTTTWAALNASRDQEKALRRRIAAVRNSSEIMHSAMLELQKRVGLAEDFLSQVQEEVPKLSSNETQAVAPTTPKPTLDMYLRESRANLGLPLLPLASMAATSFLQTGIVSSDREYNETAELFQPKLLETLSNIEKAHMHAKERLDQSFQALNASQSDRLHHVQNETNTINASLAETRGRVQQLQDAKARVEEEDRVLRARLNGFKVFTVRIASLMNDVLQAADAASSDVREDEAGK